MKKLQFELGDKTSKITILQQQLNEKSQTTQQEKLIQECNSLKSEITNKNSQLLQLTS